MLTLIYILTAYICLLQFADIFTTNIALRTSNVETNKIIATLMLMIGIMPALIVSKTIVIVTLIYGVMHNWFTSDYGVALLVFLAIFYSGVIVNNARVIKG